MKVGKTYYAKVDEALCYGWIDSILRPIDERKYVQRFSPRHRKEVFEQRLRYFVKMTAQNKRFGMVQ